MDILATRKTLGIETGFKLTEGKPISSMIGFTSIRPIRPIEELVGPIISKKIQSFRTKTCRVFKLSSMCRLHCF